VPQLPPSSTSSRNAAKASAGDRRRGIKFSGDLARQSPPAPIAPCSARSSPAPTRRRRGISLSGSTSKSYRGMGSVGGDGAAARADRYFQEEVTSTLKLVPRASRDACRIGAGRQYHPSADRGLRAAMGYTGNRRSPRCSGNCKFVQIPRRLRESHVHDIRSRGSAQTTGRTCEGAVSHQAISYLRSYGDS